MCRMWICGWRVEDGSSKPTRRTYSDFSIINFASHWQQPIGVSIVRGAASVVARAAPMGADGEAEEEVEETEASQEHNPDAR
jgi:hypothetical protein